jgi:hypothetical protein
MTLATIDGILPRLIDDQTIRVGERQEFFSFLLTACATDQLRRHRNDATDLLSLPFGGRTSG